MAVVVKEKKEKKRERNKDTKDKKSRNKITARASVFGDNALYDALLNAQPKIGVWLTFSPLQAVCSSRPLTLMPTDVRRSRRLSRTHS